MPMSRLVLIGEIIPELCFISTHLLTGLTNAVEQNNRKNRR